MRAGERLFDPFAGTATSLVVGRQAGLQAYGLEAHPFIHFIGSTKLRWDLAPGLATRVDALEQEVQEAARIAVPPPPGSLPQLIERCYEAEQLAKLLAIRDRVQAAGPRGSELRDLGEFALAAIARPAARVSTKWPYVAPRRMRVFDPKDAIALFTAQLRSMVSDLATVAYRQDWPHSELLEADARYRHPSLASGSVDLVVTSAPYLNNFDYADRTRLETYLLGWYSSWSELTTHVRRSLVMAATPHLDGIRTTAANLLSDVIAAEPKIGAELLQLVDRITAARLAARGDKKFHLMTAGYFGDMFKVLLALRDVVRKGAKVIIVLGDSALFGVHVATETLVGRLAVVAGFTSFSIQHLRARGQKWRAVRRSSDIPLIESALVLEG